MFWRTECIAYEPTCGGERRRSEPEASPEANRQARSDWRASTVEPVGKAAVATRAAEASSGQVGGGTRRWPGATPKTRAGGERGAGDRNKTLSRSCPAQKSKNFVSRGADHSAVLRGPFSPGGLKIKPGLFLPPAPSLWPWGWSRPGVVASPSQAALLPPQRRQRPLVDRKSTRLNSS